VIEESSNCTTPNPGSVDTWRWYAVALLDEVQFKVNVFGWLDLPSDGDTSVGAFRAGLTLNVAKLLVANPNVLDTTQRNVTPLSDSVVGGVLYDVLVAPETFTLPFCH
jgi:hypothetical protein